MCINGNNNHIYEKTDKIGARLSPCLTPTMPHIDSLVFPILLCILCCGVVSLVLLLGFQEHQKFLVFSTKVP